MIKSLVHTVKKYRIHEFVWLIFLVYELLVYTAISRNLPSFIDYFTHLALNILLFYIHAIFFKKYDRNFYVIILLILVELASYSFFSFYLERFLTITGLVNYGRVTKFDFSYLSRSIWRALYFIGFSTGYVYILRALEERKAAAELKTQNLINTLENQRLENELVKVENDFLRSQINPHFLFNTLSFIYNGTRKKAPEAASAILSLSEMMRYALKQPTSSETILLSAEIEQVENLINLHKLRTKDGIYLRMNVSEGIAHIRFLPLMLLTLVENIFKHGNVTNPNYPAEINIQLQNGTLSISTLNLIADKASGSSNGVGMDNVKKRLISHYGTRASINAYKIEPNLFKSEIVIDAI